jgi:hypothetical protein
VAAEPCSTGRYANSRRRDGRRLGGRALAEDVEFDLTKAAGEGNLLWGRNSLVAEEDDRVSMKGPLDLAERCLVKGPSQIDATDLAEHGIGRDNLNRHGRSFC